MGRLHVGELGGDDLEKDASDERRGFHANAKRKRRDFLPDVEAPLELDGRCGVVGRR